VHATVALRLKKTQKKLADLASGLIFHGINSVIGMMAAAYSCAQVGYVTATGFACASN
jgi:hypothetical protein